MPGTAITGVVMRQQWRAMVRDRRLLMLGLALLAVIAAVLAGGAGRQRAWGEERRQAIAGEARNWESQGPTNPHGAAHFGRYGFKPVSPLAALDPGLVDHLGVALKLEAHNQNPSRYRATDGGTSLSRFAGVSVASAIAVLAPLLVILATFGAFAGEPARTLVRQELAQGVVASTLIRGRLLALGGGVLAIVAVVGLAGLAALAAGGGAAADLPRLGLMLLGHALYLLTFLALGLAASAWFASARAALVALLAFWAMATLVLPRIVPALAEQRHPTLSGPAFEAAITAAFKNGVDGHDPRDRRLDALKATTMRRYGVTRIEDLPINFNGVALSEGERFSTGIYRAQLRSLYDGYDAQAAVSRGFALASPLLALKPLSSALAGTDLAAHRRMIEQAEVYRYRTVQALNRDIILNRKGEDGEYLRDVGAITRGERLVLTPAPLRQVLARHWLDLALLALWAAAATGLAFAAARRMARPR